MEPSAYMNAFTKEFGIRLNEFNYGIGDVQFKGYYALSGGGDDKAYVETVWRTLSKRNTRIFVGNYSIANRFSGKSIFLDCIYVMPELPVEEIVSLAETGGSDETERTSVDGVKKIVSTIYQTHPFEIVHADEEYLAGYFVQEKIAKSDAVKIEQMVMSIAPFSGDPENNVWLRDMIVKEKAFNIRLSIG